MGQNMDQMTILMRISRSNEMKKDDYILLVTSMILILAFWSWLLYLSLSEPRKRETTPLIQCDPGSCAMNMINGLKRCPTIGTVFADPEIEVCASPFACDDPKFPFAVNEDGSTNLLGSCSPGVQCRCVANPQCPEFILTTFTTQNGDPYQGLEGQRLKFPQQTSSMDPPQGFTGSYPIIFDSPATTFCTVTAEWLDRIVPGCPITIPGQPSLDDISACMNLPNSSVPGNVCTKGVLAFVPSDYNSFNSNTILQTPLGCVRGTTCPDSKFINVWNPSAGTTICRPVTDFNSSSGPTQK